MTAPFPVTQTLADFIANTPAAALDPDALAVLRLSFLDWLAVATAGIPEPVSKTVREAALADGGTGNCQVFGTETQLPAPAAALVNGVTSHALDYDDTHFLHIGHPSAAVLPAALATAQAEEVESEELLAAALIGVETACRIGSWLGRAHYEAGFHQTATSGAFGACAAAARLMGLDAERTAHALGLAATQAAGLKSQFGTMGKPYHAGLAARTGVETARLAAAGFISRPDGIECAQGFGATHAATEDRPGQSFEGLGKEFVFTRVLHKFHACCHGIHAPLEAISSLRGQVEGKDVSAMEITVHPRWLKVCHIPEPTTGLEAKFSLRLAGAAGLAGRDTASIALYTDDLCADPDLVALRDRAVVQTDEALADTAARVVITASDGSRLEASHDLDDPMPYALREEKVRAKARTLMGADEADAAWQRLIGLAS